MIAVDTNILLRFVLHDDDVQFAKASAFFDKRTSDDPAFVSLIVLAELVWALRQPFGYTREQTRLLVATLLETEEICFEDEEAVSVIVTRAKGGDIADHLIAHSARRAGCSTTVTFDQKARNIVGMELLA